MINLEEYKPHEVSIVICLKCFKRWIAVRSSDTKLVELQCPNCRQTGYVIETGEKLE